jgi:hypothetical protein
LTCLIAARFNFFGGKRLPRIRWLLPLCVGLQIQLLKPWRQANRSA